MQGFVEAHAKFTDANAQILAMSVDSWAAANAFAESLGAEFPLLGDFPLNTVAKAYGVYDEERHLSRRVTFVMDSERVIRAVIDDARDVERHVRDALAVVQSLAPASQ